MPKKIYKLRPDDRPIEFRIDYDNELNQEQLKVVKEGNGACLVLAGAGTGKTRTLVYRVAYLLEKGVAPKNILLMTFTNKAAQSMLWRVENLLGYKPQGLWGGTFHHIGNQILRQYITKLGYKKNYTILDEDDARSLLDTIIAANNLKQDKYFPKANVIKNIISFSLNAKQPIRQVLADNFSYLDTSLEANIKKIKSDYGKKKKLLNSLDYDDLLILWLELLKKSPAIKQTLSQQFQYILVDEYQDTNHLQAQIVESIYRHHGNLLVVGDDAQSIYSFRAADVANILAFPKKFKYVKIHKLETNYRSTPQILNLANHSIGHNRQQFQKTLRAANSAGDLPVLVPTADNSTQAKFVVQRIIELTESGYSLKDIAVLFRADYQALELELELNKKNVPYLKRGGLKFFEQAHLKDILSFLKIIYNPADDVAWNRIINLQPGIGRQGAQKIISAKQGLNLMQTISLPTKFPAQLQKSWQEFCQTLKPLTQIEINDISGLIQAVIDNFYGLYLKNNYENAMLRLEDLEQLINFSDNYDSLEKFISDTTLSENFQAERTGGGENPEDYLIISTIHQAKGLEWPIIFIINLSNGQFPHAKSLNNQIQVEEERRLFYVACTRAKKLLYLTYPQINYNQTYGFIFSERSEFLQELDPQLYTEWQIENNQNENLPTIEYLPEV